MSRCNKVADKKYNQFKNWYEAFFALEAWLESLPEGKKVIFLDELPWMDTPKSNFISRLEHFWNAWASARKEVFFYDSYLESICYAYGNIGAVTIKVGIRF